MAVTAKGLEGVVANESALSLVNGQDGELRYLGYHIDDLVEHTTFEEVIFLLHKGKLPNKSELDEFTASLRGRRKLPQGVIDFLKAAPKDAAPMDVLRTGVSMLGLYDHRGHDQDYDLNEERGLSLCAQVPLIVAYYHRDRQGLDLPPVRDDLGEAAHFLYLVNGEEPSAEAAKTLDVAYILHADHGMNASTFSARVTIATLSDMYSAITSAIGTLKGPLHGGANEGVIHMLEDIGEVDKVDAYVEGKLERKEKIMGFGHRVYKSKDPRAAELQTLARTLAEDTGNIELYEKSHEIEKIMEREVASKGIYPNVDFYSATTYHCIGLKLDLFTPMFALSRIAGWSGHVIEQLADNRLFRPKAQYVGPHDAPYVPISER